MHNYIHQQIVEAQQVMKSMLADTALQETLGQAASACIQSLNKGGKVLLAGNGGSAPYCPVIVSTSEGLMGAASSSNSTSPAPGTGVGRST
jgi:phosphoheptose isomerase